MDTNKSKKRNSENDQILSHKNNERIEIEKCQCIILNILNIFKLFNLISFFWWFWVDHVDCYDQDC